MAATALLAAKPKPTDADIDAAMTNICRCGTYQQVREAIHAARQGLRGGRIMTIPDLRLGRRGFLVSGAAVAGGFSLGFSVPFGGGARRRGEGDQRLGGDPSRRQGGDPHRPLRDGAGHADRPRPARRRGAGVRLDQGHLGISDARREPEAQPRLEELLDRRQPRHPREQPVCPRGRRHGARDADRGGGGRSGRCRRANAARPTASSPTSSGKKLDLRRGRRRGGPARAAQGSEAQGSQGLEDRRQADQAPRHARQGHRQADLRHRLHACPACWSRPCAPAR